MSLSKEWYDLLNLSVCIKGQADRLGIEHEGVPGEGVVVRIAEAAIEARGALASVRALHTKRDDGWCTACAEFNDLTSEVQE